jgi:hypothetical protein
MTQSFRMRSGSLAAGPRSASRMARNRARTWSTGLGGGTGDVGPDGAWAGVGSVDGSDRGPLAGLRGCRSLLDGWVIVSSSGQAATCNVAPRRSIHSSCFVKMSRARSGAVATW